MICVTHNYGPSIVSFTPQKVARANSARMRTQLQSAMAATEKLKQARSIVAATEAAIAAMELQVDDYQNALNPTSTLMVQPAYYRLCLPLKLWTSSSSALRKVERLDWILTKERNEIIYFS